MKNLSIMILTVLIGLTVFGASHAAKVTKNGHLYTRHWHVESAKEENRVCSISVGDRVDMVRSIVWSGKLYVRLEVLEAGSDDCEGWTKPEYYRQ